MTAVIYARYSSDNQREESIEGQIRECTAYAEKNGITVIKHYIDRALSAKTDNRPEFQQMIKDSEKRLFDIVLVWKLDRFARNRYDSAHYEYQLERNHVKLVSATEPISEGPAGIMVKSMLTGMAEYYSAELSEKVVRGMTENVLKGKYNGGTIPIGYTVDEEKFFQIDPLKAPFVVEAFQRYNDGATMKELMNWLNDSGVTTNRNQKFTYNNIQTLLTNRRYIGENRFKDIVMPDSIPVIIEKELFDSVQDKIAKNRRAPARHKAEDDYLLTTKLFCGMCGAMMFGECGTSRNKNVHHYYKCANAKRTKTCKKKTVRKEWLEDLVVCETMKMIHDDDCIQSIVDAVMILQEQENTVLPLLEKELAAGAEPFALVQDVLIPAITEVGTRYERREYFLPQLIRAAETMQKAFAHLKPLLEKSRGPEERPVIVMATVEGDIHDIGKNIVCLLLGNHGFDVIDAGKDVPAEQIVACALEHKARIIGLSALMTTTMVRMEDTIRLVRERNLPIKVLVGGAAVTQAFADAIGADAYCEDAVSAVRAAKQFVTG